MIFTATAVMISLVPFSADDWTWGSQIGTDRLADFFEGYNGRYVSNLAVLLLTRVPALVPVVTAAGITLTIFLLLDLTDNRTRLGYGATLVLFLGMPLEVWRQSIVWLSGFVNYGLSGLALLVFLRAAKTEWSRPAGRSAGLGTYLGIAVVGFCSTMIMEHVTIYLVAASFAFLVLHRLRFGRFSVPGAVWLVSLTCGAAVMFSNSAYRAAVGGHANGYQHIDTVGDGSFILNLLDKLADPISAYMATQNVLVGVALVLLTCLVVNARAVELSVVARRAVLATAVAFLALVFVLRIAREELSYSPEYKALSLIGAGLLLAMLGALARVVIEDRSRQAQVYIACASLLVLAAPLTMANPISPRCFYASYLVLLAVSNVLLKEAVERVDALRLSRSLPLAAGATALALFASFFMAYWVADGAAERRIAELRAAVAAGASSVEITELPFGDYIHGPDPKGGFWSPRFKLFYGLPDGLKIHVVPRSQG